MPHSQTVLRSRIDVETPLIVLKKSHIVSDDDRPLPEFLVRPGGTVVLFDRFRSSRVSRETGAYYKQIYVREPRQILLASSTPQFALSRRSQIPLRR